MNFSALRARPWGTALAFFVVGVLFASAMDWTPFSHAQQQTANKPSAAAVKSLTETSDAFVSIAEHVTPAVVAVQTQTVARPHPLQDNRGRPIDPQNIPPQFRQFFDNPGGVQEGTGSGFVISPDGYIVTNNHVVAEADKITVLMTDRKSYTAKLIGHDPQTDVAVIKIDAKNLPTVALGDDERLRVGEWVLAVGNPLGLDFTVTAGIVSAKGRGSRDVSLGQGTTSITDYIQTDAAINPGNSGGPLVNIRGEVVGINAAIASSTGMYAGYGFAIPIGLARTVWEDLIAHGHIIRAQLGISITDVTAEDAEVAGLKDITGVKVSACNPADVPAKSPACAAGVKPGDVVVSLDGKPVDRVSALQRIVRAKKPGESVEVKLMRYGKQLDYSVKLNQMAPDENVVASAAEKAPAKGANVGAKLGIWVEPVSDELVASKKISREYRGLQVTDVDLTGPAAKLLQPDFDIIVAVLPTGEPIRTAADLQRVLASKRNHDVVSLSVYGTDSKQTRVVNIRVGG